MQPSYPVYIISKGRWESRLTSKALEAMKVPYHIVIEPQEYENYASVIDKRKILVLPFSNLGQGSIPARNWVWEHSLSIGAKRHWIMDDNISSFLRANNNHQVAVASGTILCCMEDFVDRYENVALAGPQYDYFSLKKEKVSPYFLNTRIYSCLLIKNDLQHRWRGRYNEDTDLSLRVLKDGLCTILFYAFLQMKVPTLQMKGGNTDELYNQGDNRLQFARDLREQHPDVVKITKKFGRYHHQVNYAPFKYNKLIKKKGLIIPDRINNYGMKLINIGEK